MWKELMGGKVHVLTFRNLKLRVVQAEDNDPRHFWVVVGHKIKMFNGPDGVPEVKQVAGLKRAKGEAKELANRIRQGAA